jgi:UDP-N-acetylmuramyl tripeptide synthase
MEIRTQARIPGPNRRGEKPIIEQRLIFSDDSDGPSAGVRDALPMAVRERLQQMGCNGSFTPGAGQDGSEPVNLQLGRLFAQLALHLQQQAGHHVFEFGAVPDDEGPVWAWFEYDHPEVGQAAARMALAMIRDALQQHELEPGDADFSQGRFNHFLEFARTRCLSMETRALQAAARRREIPCFNLDRYPYDPLEGPFRIRPNGLLRLGHARYQYVLDGTLCVNWNPRQTSVLRDPRGLRSSLQAVGIPMANEATAGARRVLVIGDRIVATIGPDGARDGCGPDSATREQVAAVCRQFSLPVFAAEIAASGGWLGLDIAPSLDSWFPEGGAELDQAADLLLAQLYPPGSRFRIPIISVTGTNGKTTTCTMLGHILKTAEQSPVVVSSTGVWLDQEPQGKRSEFGPASAYYALEAPGAGIAVFEDYFGSIVHFGFAYDWCDVAVCTNVTVDHLHHMGAHTLEQITAIKFAPVRRARKAVVLNADNEHCATMLQHSTAERKVAVSMESDHATLLSRHDAATHCCVLEDQNGRECIALYGDGSRHVVIATADIPATMNALARHNVSNAMHAAAAAWMAGVAPERIAAALGTFASTITSCRGRLNEFTGLPYRVILDYAHNADGFRMMSTLLDAQPVPGRKTILVRFTSDRRAAELRVAMAELAGHFDLYVCTNYPSSFRRVITDNVPELIQAALLEFGVEAQAIQVIPDHRRALDWTLHQAQPGDLLLLLLASDEFEPVWDRLENMKSAQGANQGANQVANQDTTQGFVRETTPVVTVDRSA